MRIVLFLFCSAIYGASSSSSSTQTKPSQLNKAINLYTIGEKGFVKNDLILSDKLTLDKQGLKKFNIRVIRQGLPPYFIALQGSSKLSEELVNRIWKNMGSSIIAKFLRNNFYQSDRGFFPYIGTFKYEKSDDVIKHVIFQDNYIFTFHAFNSVRVWNSADLRLIGALKDSSGNVFTGRFLEDEVCIQDNYVVLNSDFRTACIFRLADLSLVEFKDENGVVLSDVHDIKLQGDYVVTRHCYYSRLDKGRVRVWKSADLALIGVLKDENGVVLSDVTDIKLQGDYVVTSHGTGLVRVWKSANLALIGALKNAQGQIKDVKSLVRVDIRDKYIVYRSHNSETLMRSLADLSLVEFKDENGVVLSDVTDIKLQGDYVVTSHGTGLVRVWKSANLALIGALKGAIHPVICGNYVLVTYRDQTKVWRLPNLSPIDATLPDLSSFAVDIKGSYISVRDKSMKRSSAGIFRIADLSKIGELKDAFGKILSDIVDIELRDNYAVTSHNNPAVHNDHSMWAWRLSDLSLVIFSTGAGRSGGPNMRIGRDRVAAQFSDESWGVWRWEIKKPPFIDQLTKSEMVFLCAAIEGLFAEVRQYKADGTYIVTGPVRIGGTASITAAELNTILNTIYEKLSEDIKKILRGYPYNVPDKFEQWSQPIAAKSKD